MERFPRQQHCHSSNKQRVRYLGEFKEDIKARIYKTPSTHEFTVKYSVCEGSGDDVLLLVGSWVVEMINKMVLGSSSQLTDCIDLWPSSSIVM